MKQLSQAIKVGILLVIMVAGSYGVWKTVGSSPSGSESYTLWAKFRDASGLPVGSRVVIAGLPVGEISGLDIAGRHAKVTFKVRHDVEVWDNAIAFKKSSSLLGDYYIEIDPGTAESVGAKGQTAENEQLEDGDEIKRVVEATSPEDLMRRMEETIPKVDAVLLSVRDLSEDVRGIVNGPLANIASRLDGLVQEEADTVERILTRTDRALATVEQIAGDIRTVTSGADGQITTILENLKGASAEAEALMTTARGEVETTAKAVRDRLDQADTFLGNSAEVAQKVNSSSGTLGRLVNDPTIANNVEDITEGAKGFTETLFGMQTYVGLRSEYNVFAQLARHYVTVELYTRPDKFYYIELVKGPRGRFPDISLQFDPEIGRFRRNIEIQDEFAFTFQFAKRIDWLTLRYGIKESSGGIGADASWFDNKLKLSMDIFDAGFDTLPRLKLSAAYQMFKHLYVLAGVDDALNDPEELDIEPDTDVPGEFSELRYGRDVFLGAQLRFNDHDLAALLTVGGAALAGASGE